VSKIYSVADMFSDPQFLARQMIERHLLPDGTSMAVPAVTPKLSATPGQTRWLGPKLGEHTDEILAALGYDAADRQRLLADRVV
jgi:formyl-CoA transferase